MCPPCTHFCELGLSRHKLYTSRLHVPFEQWRYSLEHYVIIRTLAKAVQVPNAPALDTSLLQWLVRSRWHIQVQNGSLILRLPVCRLWHTESLWTRLPKWCIKGKRWEWNWTKEALGVLPLSTHPVLSLDPRLSARTQTNQNFNWSEYVRKLSLGMRLPCTNDHRTAGRHWPIQAADQLCLSRAPLGGCRVSYCYRHCRQWCMYRQVTCARQWKECKVTYMYI